MRSKQPYIIFDFGNVILPLDYQTCFSSFERCLGLHWDKDSLPNDLKYMMDQLEIGSIDEKAFLNSFKKYNEAADINALKNAWNSLLKKIPPSRFEFLKQIKLKYRFALLSNINSIHEKYINEYLKKEHDIDLFSEYFDKVYYSHHLGMRKPNISIYNYVTDDLGVDPQEILFVDDLSENIEAAKSIGWKGEVHNPVDRIEDKLEYYIKSNFI